MRKYLIWGLVISLLTVVAGFFFTKYGQFGQGRLSNNVVTCEDSDLIGDGDGDGTLTARDLQLIASIISERIPAPTEICCVDVNQDGMISAADLQMLSSIIMNNLQSPGICQLSSPPTAALNTVKVLEIRYITPDGRKILNKSAGKLGLDGMRQFLDTATYRLLDNLTEGTAYHGYKDPDAIPYIGYEIVDTIEYIDSNFPTKECGAPDLCGNPALTTQIDYYQILTESKICEYIDNQDVQEIWLWLPEYTDPYQWESNMSMGRNIQSFWNYPSHGDVSNSQIAKQNDLPICEKTYTAYHYNENRIDKLGHNHMHQFEAIFNWVDRPLFWGTSSPDPKENRSFVDQHLQNKPNNFYLPRSCGWIHAPANALTSFCIMPLDQQENELQSFLNEYPNLNLKQAINKYNDLYCVNVSPPPSPENPVCMCNKTKTVDGVLQIDHTACQEILDNNRCLMKDYLLTNTLEVESDCENWNPDATEPIYTTVNCNTWYGPGDCKQAQATEGELPFQKYWMQNVPGTDHGLTYNGQLMRNWWEFVADFDNALLGKGKTFLEPPRAPLPKTLN